MASRTYRAAASRNRWFAILTPRLFAASFASSRPYSLPKIRSTTQQPRTSGPSLRQCAKMSEVLVDVRPLPGRDLLGLPHCRPDADADDHDDDPDQKSPCERVAVGKPPHVVQPIVL